MSCLNLDNNLDIKNATKDILNSIYKYTSNKIYIPDNINIFSSDFKGSYSNIINIDLDNINNDEGLENLAKIDNENNSIYANCVFKSSIPWYTTNIDNKKCIITDDIDNNLKNKIQIDKKTGIVTPILKSTNNQKSVYCPYFSNVNKAFCENRWYDWITVPNYYLGNTYYKDTSQYTEADVYKCYAPCTGDYMPYTKSNGDLKCIPKKYFNNGIFTNKYFFSSFGLINLIGNIALSNDEKNTKQTNLLYILHQLIISYNDKNLVDDELYEKHPDVYKWISNFNKEDYNEIYNQLKSSIDTNIFKIFSTSQNQDYSLTNEFTYKHRKFNEDESEMFSLNGLDLCKVLIDPILIHTWILANLFQPLNTDFNNNTNTKIINSDSYITTVTESLLYNKLYVIFQDEDKALRLKNIFFKAVNICYNNNTNFSMNIIERTKNAFNNIDIITQIKNNNYYWFNNNIFMFNDIITTSTSTSYPLIINDSNNNIYQKYIDNLLNSEKIDAFKEYKFYMDYDLDKFIEEIKIATKFYDYFFKKNNKDNKLEEIENAKFRYFFSVEKLEKPSCNKGYEWNDTYKVCDLKKVEVEKTTEDDFDSDFQIPQLKNLLLLFIQIVVVIIILYIIYVCYDIFSEILISMLNGSYYLFELIKLKINNCIIYFQFKTKPYDIKIAKLQNMKAKLEKEYENIEAKDLKIDSYIKSNK